jgi:DNA polymerase III subunit alpha
LKFWTPDFYLKSRLEMMEMFGEVEDALDRTWEIAQRCQVKLEKIKEPFPKFDVPTGHTADSFFEYVARQGFEKRRARLEVLHADGRLKHHLAEYAERLDREIRMIQQMKFSGYFLVVWDFIRFSKSQGIPVGPGRGSAAGSLVSYSMGITDIDPLQYGLLFERTSPKSTAASRWRRSSPSTPSARARRSRTSAGCWRWASARWTGSPS